MVAFPGNYCKNGHKAYCCRNNYKPRHCEWYFIMYVEWFLTIMTGAWYGNGNLHLPRFVQVWWAHIDFFH